MARELASTVQVPGAHVEAGGGRGGTGPAATPAGRLIPGLSTAYSDTWQRPGDPHVTRIYAAPVNYRDAQGAWRPIANELTVSSAGGYVNRANSFVLRVPGQLTQPVSLSRHGFTVRFALQGARGQARVSGAAATFLGALRSTDVEYQSQSTGVLETVTLKDLRAPSLLRFEISASPGLRAKRQRTGAIELIDRRGRVRFTIPAAVAYAKAAGPKAARALSFSLSAHGHGWLLTVKTDAAWLRRLLRRGPVVVDPSVTVGPTDCSIDSHVPTANSCTTSLINEGYYSPDQYRALLQFNLSSVPADSLVLNAQLGLYLQAETSTNTKSVGVYRATQPWTTGTTWNTYDGTHNWTTAGGDFSAGQDAVINPSVGGSTGWAYWYPTQMVQEWLDGPTSSTGSSPAGYTNDGLVVKDVNEGTTSNQLSFDSQYATSNQPYLDISWEPRGLGDSSQLTYLSTPLTDKLTASVNPASGDLRLVNTDLSVKGTGLSYVSAHTWNSLNPEYQGYGQWTDSNNVNLVLFPDGSATFNDGDGAWFPFIAQSNGSFVTPVGIHAILCGATSPAPCPTTLPSGIAYELIYNSSRVTYEFNSAGIIMKVVDRYGNGQTMSYDNNGYLSQIADSQGRQFKYASSSWSDGAHALSSVQDVAGGRSVSFGYTYAHGYHEVTSFIDAAGNTTTYGYEPYGILTSITTPAGHQILMAFDAPGRIEWLKRVTNTSAQTGPTTDFTYYDFGTATSLGCASNQKAVVVTDPDGVDGAAGHKTTYCSNVDDEVQKTLDANGNPTTATFDPFGNQTSTTAAARGTGLSAGVSSAVYDPTGQNVNCEVSGSTSQQTTCPNGPMASGYSTRYFYGSSTQPYQPSQITDPQSNITTLCYNGDSSCSSGTTPAGSLKSITDGLLSQNSLNYSYNSNGTVSSSQDADGNTTSYGYDSAGNLTSITPPSGSGQSPITITNDADSRPYVISQCVTASPCSSPETATITYDNLDRATQVVYAGPVASTTVQYVYDKDGNLYQRIDPHGTTTYTVDGLDRITNETDPGSVSYSYAYDDASNLTCFTDSGGNTTYAYNGLNEMTDMYEKDPSCGAKTSSTHDSFAYDNDQGLTKITYPSGVNINYGLDPTTGRIMSITTKNSAGTTLRSATYSFTNGSNDTSLIQGVTDTVGSATNTTSYTYDALNRLVTAITGGSSPNPAYYHYGLDGAGNRTSQTVNPTGSTGGTTTYYNYNAGNELLCRMTTNAACSNSSSTELSGYGYDQIGNQTAINAFSDPSATAFAYNNANQTTSLTPSGSSAQALSYLGAGQDDLTALGSSTLQNSQLGLTQQTNASGTSYYARTPDGLLVDERLPSATNYNPLYDAQGDIVGLTNSSGTLVQTVRYGPYGENTNATGTVSYSATTDPFLFQGGYHTPGGNTGAGNVPNGLYHYGARYYDPTTGRWTQPDPLNQITDLTQSDRYTFASNDPTNQADPSGAGPINDARVVAEDPCHRFHARGVCGGASLDDLAALCGISSLPLLTINPAYGIPCAAVGTADGIVHFAHAK